MPEMSRSVTLHHKPARKEQSTMETQVANATEYRNVSLSLLNESKTNPRRVFDDASLRELAESIRTHGVLSPLLVRPLTENGFEIVFGARRYRAARIAKADSVPVRIKEMTDAQALEAQLIELSIVVKRFLAIDWAPHVVYM
jgi:ParB family transcriptional regulator, chromosome partitioning protein